MPPPKLNLSILPPAMRAAALDQLREGDIRAGSRPRRPRARRGSGETGLVKTVIAYLRALGRSADRCNSGVLLNPAGRPVRFGEVGAADITGSLPIRLSARSLAIECKTAAGKLRPTQRTWLNERRRRGWMVLVVRPADWQRQIDAALVGLPTPETDAELGAFEAIPF